MAQTGRQVRQTAHLIARDFSNKYLHALSLSLLWPISRPKHPLSAYNIFFQLERARMIVSLSNGVNQRPAAITADDVCNLQLHQPKLPRRLRNPTRIPELSFVCLARTIAD
jgi:hypothetical protein